MHRTWRIPAFAGAVLLLLTGSLAQQQTATHTPASPPEIRVDINHASVEELVKVPGMTRTWAARIVRFRPCRAKNELLDRGVIPNDVYERIKDDIVAHRDKQ